MEAMNLLTVVTKRGQTVVPALIRRRYAIREGDHLAWLDDGQEIKVIPIPNDPVDALYGRGVGEKMMDALMAYRKDERSHEP
jgi:AbrB family looped-hinge helix DNA binding protein